MYLCDPICNILKFSVFGHTSCGKHDVLWYGVEEANYVNLHEVTSDSDLIVLIKDALGNTCYLYSIHMLDSATHCFPFQVWYVWPIDILDHSDILLQDWKFLQDVIVYSMKDSLYWLTNYVLELPCTISLFNIAGGVSFLFVLHLWYRGMWVVHHGVRILAL